MQVFFAIANGPAGQGKPTHQKEQEVEAGDEGKMRPYPVAAGQ